MRTSSKIKTKSEKLVYHIMFGGEHYRAFVDTWKITNNTIVFVNNLWFNGLKECVDELTS